jgi:hypothetical protein
MPQVFEYIIGDQTGTGMCIQRNAITFCAYSIIPDGIVKIRTADFYM